MAALSLRPPTRSWHAPSSALAHHYTLSCKYFLANDRFLPRQFTHRGDRLGFSNGILALGLISGVLVVAFGAREQALLPLYAVGVFMSFTLSQFSMTVRAWRLRQVNWLRNMIISGFGSFVTFVVLMVIAITRFSEGAWAVLVLIPIIVIILLSIHRHYSNVARQLSLVDAPRPQAVKRH